MTSQPIRPTSLRDPRIKMDESCTLYPWKSSAKLVNLSMSGALIYCEVFPDGLHTAIKGQLEIRDHKYPGEFVRLDSHKVAMEFAPLDVSQKQEIEKILASMQQS